MAKIALIIVDMQNDFVRPTGKLYVPNAESLIGPIADLIHSLQFEWDLIVFTQDWHPASHTSFSKFPPHCIQNTTGAEIVSELKFCDLSQVNFQKGYMHQTDSMSAFTDDTDNCTGLCAKLKALNISTVHIVGVATEYCVRATALSAVKFGFDVYLHLSLIRGVDQMASIKTLDELLNADVYLVP